MCVIEGCEREHYARGWCHVHYGRQRVTGDPGPSEIRQYGRKVCSIEGCEGKHFSIGLCSKHHQRWRAHGDPTMVLDTRAEIVDYPAVHWRLRKDRGSAAGHACQHCRQPADSWAYDHTDIDELMDADHGPYSLDQSRYMPLCFSCHTRFDRRAKEASRHG